MKIRVVLVEDHPVTQEGLASALSRDPAFDIVGRADTGAEGIAVVVAQRPDVAMLDMHLPDMGGVELIEHLQREAPETRTLVVTASEHADTLLQAVAAGASGYLTKRSTPIELQQAVTTVYAGGSVISPMLAGHLLRAYSSASKSESDVRTVVTDRERSVLRLLAQGYTDKEIAGELYMSARTVQHHLANVRAKLGLSRRAELARWATEHSL